MKKINVSQERCIGCGACVAIDPEHFAFNDEGRSFALTSENLESSNLVNAMESCPTSAIEVMENEGTCDCDEECDCDDDCECVDCHCEDCDCDCSATEN